MCFLLSNPQSTYITSKPIGYSTVHSRRSYVTCSTGNSIDITHLKVCEPGPSHCKKSFSIFPSPAGMSFTKLSLGGNNLYMTSLFPPRKSLVIDIPAGDGNIKKLFLQCRHLILVSLHHNPLSVQQYTLEVHMYPATQVTCPTWRSVNLGRMTCPVASWMGMVRQVSWAWLPPGVSWAGTPSSPDRCRRVSILRRYFWTIYAPMIYTAPCV